MKKLSAICGMWYMNSVRRISKAHTRGYFAKKFYVSRRRMPERGILSAESGVLLPKTAVLW